MHIRTRYEPPDEEVRPAAFDKELFKGTMPLMLLCVIGESPQYGYQIIKQLEALSAGSFTIKEGTLYPILHGFERDGLVAASWEEAAGRQRKYYALTARGRSELDRRRQEWTRFVDAMSGVLTGGVRDDV